VYPNTPEGEKLITSLSKQIAAFTIGHLGDQKIDQQFINDFLKTFVDPQLIHDAPHCEWDSSTQTLLTREELAEDSASKELENQGWWKDVVLQYEGGKDKSSKRAYASQNALFDLDEAQSVKTMHEAYNNGGANTANTPSKRVRILQQEDQQQNSAAESFEESSGPHEDRGSRRLGHTPKSVGVRGDISSDKESTSESSHSDASQEAIFTASVADQIDHLPGTDG
jgi:hypothetical protein